MVVRSQTSSVNQSSLCICHDEKYIRGGANVVTAFSSSRSGVNTWAASVSSLASRSSLAAKRCSTADRQNPTLGRLVTGFPRVQPGCAVYRLTYFTPAHACPASVGLSTRIALCWIKQVQVDPSAELDISVAPKHTGCGKQQLKRGEEHAEAAFCSF